MLTRKETLEYLSAYSTDADQISLVLLELGEDPDGSEFPDDIVERAEQVFEAFGKANTQAISGSRDEKSITVQQISEIASELLEAQDISIPADVIMALAQARVLQSIELADKLSLLEERALVTRLGQNRVRLTEKLLGISDQHNETIDAVLGDEAQAEFIQAAAPALPTTKDMVQAFIGGLSARQKASRQISGTREQERKALPAKKVDVKAFLASCN